MSEITDQSPVSVYESWFSREALKRVIQEFVGRYYRIQIIHNDGSITEYGPEDAADVGVVRTIPEDATHFRERFLEKVEKDAPGGCWEWTAYKTSGGYGGFWTQSGDKHAHRISYRMYVGPIPDDLVVRHLCHNRTCVNPDHLKVGTQAANIQDSIERGTHTRGVDRVDGFTEAEVRDIRRRYNETEITMAELAEEYDVSLPTISRVIRRLTYRYVD
jgi:hypothetical protein